MASFLCTRSLSSRARTAHARHVVANPSHDNAAFRSVRGLFFGRRLFSSTGEEEQLGGADDYDEFIADMQAGLDDEDCDAENGAVDDWQSDEDKSLGRTLQSVPFPGDWGHDIEDDIVSQIEKHMRDGRKKELSMDSSSYDEDSGRDHFHRYTRDPTDDKARLVDETAVDQLINLRTKALRRGDHDLADQLRDELSSVHGIFVWDKEKIWTTNPVPPHMRSSSVGEQSIVSTGVRLNRHGHDYAQIGDGIDPKTCHFSLVEINSKLSQMTRYELAKEFHRANAIRSELIASGVKIESRTKQWRADGGTFAHVDSRNETPYVRSQFSNPVTEEKRAQIDRLLYERSVARKRREYDLSDDIEEELWELYRVTLDHRERTWGVIEEYIRSPHSLPLSDPKSEAEVRALLSDRLEATHARDFKLADFIKQHLFDVHDVSIDDKRMQWSIGGKFGTVEAFRDSSETSSTRQVRSYNRRGGTGHLSPKEVTMVDALIRRRAQFLADSDEAAADSIRSGLKEKYGVSVDDFNQEYHIDSESYVLSPLQKEPLLPAIEEAREEIEGLIRERSKARAEKDYERADSLRDVLETMYGVLLDDRTKEWFLEPPSGSKVGVLSKDGMSRLEKALDSDMWPGEEEFPPEDADEHDMFQESNAFEASIHEESLASLTVAQLKARLRRAGLPVSGRKAELIERLRTTSQ